MSGKGLSGVRTAELRALLTALEAGRVPAPLSADTLAAAGFADAPALAAVLGALDRAGAATLLAAVLAERAARDPVRLELVWTGPEPRVSYTRDTSVVVRQLFDQARHAVLVAGFSFDHGADILKPLHEAMGRGVSARIIGTKATADTFFPHNWPFDGPPPALYYDPRALDATTYTSMHAKCVVVDDLRTLVTSANFTDRGHHRNIELGVLIDDKAFATKVLTHWQTLIDNGLLVESRG